MEIQEAIKVIRALTDGVNAETRELLKDDSICRNPQAVMALNRALAALGIFTQQDSAQLLRASTYGARSVEFALGPDYFLTISNSLITVFAGQASTPSHRNHHRSQRLSLLRRPELCAVHFARHAHQGHSRTTSTRNIPYSYGERHRDTRRLPF
jgi:hypothetical protein